MLATTILELVYKASHTGRIVSVGELSDTLDSETADNGDTVNMD